MAVAVATSVAEAVRGTTVTITVTGADAAGVYCLHILHTSGATQTIDFTADGAGGWSGSMVIQNVGTYTLSVVPATPAAVATTTVIGA